MSMNIRTSFFIYRYYAFTRRHQPRTFDGSVSFYKSVCITFLILIINMSTFNLFTSRFPWIADKWRPSLGKRRRHNLRWWKRKRNCQLQYQLIKLTKRNVSWTFGSVAFAYASIAPSRQYETRDMWLPAANFSAVAGHFALHIYCKICIHNIVRMSNQRRTTSIHEFLIYNHFFAHKYSRKLCCH